MGIVTFRTILQAEAAGFEVYDYQSDRTIVRKRIAGAWQMALCLEVRSRR